MKLLAVRRLFRIQRVVIRYRLDDLLFALPLPWWMLAVRFVLPWRWLPRSKSELSRGTRFRLALQDLGPIFIKFGQLLSTRRDLLPEDIADELMLLQDRVPPFDQNLAIKLIEEQLGAKICDVFSRFDETPLASASVAQVHAARLKTGEEVVVKVVRPGLKPIIGQDLAWLFILARTAERVSADARLLHPVQVVMDYEKTIYDELDLLREAANSSQLRRNFEGSELLYVPQVYWDWCRPKVLVMERIYGVQVTDLATLADQRTDMKLLAERGVEIFFTQIFRDSFFHADMHPGNIFISTVSPWSPQYIAIDCGIVGSLTPEDQDYLARNLFAFFKRDYRRVAQLHIDSGWVPAETKLNEFEAAIRTVCEPIFEKPLKDISFGQVLMRLFQTARRFNMEVQPQLVLLQKTLLNIEGLGRQLYPELDLWSTAQPYLERWMRERVSPKTLVSNLQSQVEQLPHIANMTRDLLERLSRPHASDPPNPWRENRDGWALRLIGSALLAGGVIQGWVISEAGTQLPTLAAWPAAIMLIAGLYLIVRR
ncbi:MULTISPECIES: ubiquinone biosynthesis regulatory protein kinase UbiB [Pseudomonas syringae group]|uniref:ubiquinone biosynthesis regulatory protein kinase UbiB n=1 Tax=Pseudomonas syringae group TaxID=136849 RepID=UPI0005B7291D|nr:ubiquinone biosynthesis regulatory protein kinase UbiB [Pseudomonas viridiflava]MBD8568657.1 ubiquinone biosynthesis regulatory protein kinase UbiB [Pseudomonas syringae]KIQ35508.1 ubiquinone biosynthesis protein UbiB [Pseudomonas viridiflava]MBD8808288.1 ubiquinone biosynthesis regulatory protein kinase UbiB [Pseudomonas syringae]MEE4082456.1 ubiquinone biosynthesis regulatory protein kinase UbiB [Pseudomonas viridiflava]MEE4100117.1 ubiquinone biosynthesis regulatory protein kinase UbiB [